MNSESYDYDEDFEDATDALERKDYKTAYKLFLRLAAHGDADAQYSLGLMYDLGDGIPQNYKKALKWYLLAAEQGSEEAIKYRDIAESKMTTEQITKAYQLAHDYIDEKPLDLGDINDPAPWLGDIDNN